MKFRITALLAVTVLSSTQLCADFKTKDEALQAITSTHTRVFSRDNLLLVPIAEEDNAAWNKLIENLQEYVNRRWVKSDELQPFFDTAAQASFQILNTLRTVYQRNIMPAIYTLEDQQKGLSTLNTKKIDLARINFEDVKKLIQPIQKLIQPLQEAQDKLQAKLAQYRASSITHRFNGDTAEALIRFAVTVEATAAKVLNDLKKLEQTQEQK